MMTSEVWLAELWPGIGDHFDVGLELLEELRVLRRGVATVGIIRRARRPFVEFLALAYSARCMVPAMRRARPDALHRRRWGADLGGLAVVWRQATPPRSRTTSWTANEADEASASIKSSQPVLFTSSRATWAASWGWPFESRNTNSIGRPRKPPAALMRFCSINSPFREEVPSSAIGPDRMPCMPMRTYWSVPWRPRGRPAGWQCLLPTSCDAYRIRSWLHLPRMPVFREPAVIIRHQRLRSGIAC